MPKMSGYDMIEKIRDQAALLDVDAINAQPYVIAITANALKGEKENCLNAGINDFITKPVELNKLEEKLDKWSNKDATTPPAFQSVKAKTPINLEVLATYIQGDEAKQIRFFKMYLEQSNDLTKEINTGVIASDNQKITDACHQLKSISKTIGAEKVAELAAEFEKHCKAECLTSDELIEHRDSLEIEYSKVAQYLKEQVKKAPVEDELF